MRHKDTMNRSSPQIFCALDTADLDQALSWAKQIAPVIGGIKLGMEFINSFGPQGIEKIQKAAPDAALFIDLKFHDIPNTVAGAVRTVTRHFAPMYLNLHAAGGRSMMEAAKAACENNSKLLAVTILTSLNDQEIKQVGYSAPMAEQVQNMARLSQESGMDGAVCSAHEIEILRSICGHEFVLMVPGIRPAGSAIGDQSRIMTPREALQKGATHLVIGRPITSANDPALAAQDILDSLK